MRNFSLSLILIVVSTVSTALLQGQMRSRWGATGSAQKSAALMSTFPADFGDWRMISASELDEESQKQLECLVGMVRVYKNTKTDEQVNLLFIFGPMGPTAAHTPEVCMSEREFAPLGERREAALGPHGDRCWNKLFKSKTLHGELQSVYWAWNADGKWVAAKDARYQFAGNPYLYKVQVASWLHNVADGDLNNVGLTGSKSSDAGQQFLTEFVPVAANYITAKSKEQ